MYLLASAIVFAIYVINVALGAMGSKPFLGDVGELYLLLTTSILFVIAILQSEKNARS